jgi:hypothetical protein
MAQVDSENSTAAPGGRPFTQDAARLAKEAAKRRRAITFARRRALLRRRKRVRTLSDRQRKILTPKVDRSKVGIY